MFKFVYEDQSLRIKKSVTLHKEPDIYELLFAFETFAKDCFMMDDLSLDWHICEPSKPKTTKKTKGKAQ
jgi:hypothetical protein